MKEQRISIRCDSTRSFTSSCGGTDAHSDHEQNSVTYLPLNCTAEHDVTQHDEAFWSVWDICLVAFHPPHTQPLAHSQSLYWAGWEQGRVKRREVLDAVQTLSSSTYNCVISAT